jgi:hypothetical protein
MISCNFLQVVDLTPKKKNELEQALDDLGIGGGGEFMHRAYRQRTECHEQHE